MADNFLYVQTQPTTLAGSGAVSGATSITLTSFYQIDGTTALTMADFGAIGYGTLEPGNGTQEEQISFTGVTANANGTFTLSGIKTVLTVAPYTETSGLARSHPGASKFVISNTAGFYNRLTSKNDDETIAGTWTFTEPNVPRLDATHTYGAGEELYFATYGVVASTSYAGTVNASTTAKGIVEEAYQSEVDTGAAAGGTGARLFFPPSKLRSRLMSDYVADTGTATAYAIAPSPVITQYLAGAIFTFKASHTNNGAATLAVNGLATKNIQKNANGSQGAALIYGDIVTNSLVAVQYDGTQFQLLSPPVRNVTADATNTISSGVTIPASQLSITSQATGDLLYASSGSAWARLGIGTASQYLAGGTIPGWSSSGFSRRVASKTTAVTIANDATETDLVATTIPANAIGAYGAVRARFYITDLDHGASPRQFTIKVKYGGSTLITHNSTPPTGNTTNLMGIMECLVVGAGATNSQRGIVQYNFGKNESPDNSTTTSMNAVDTGTSAVDSTSAQAFSVTFKWDTAAVTCNITSQVALVEIIS